MPLKDLTLLYIEDDKETQKQLKLILEDEVKEFYQAYDGKEGLKLYEEKKPDIVLTDIRMPFLDGFDVAKEIKKRDENQPVVMISSFADTDNLLKAINTMIDAFIVKPVDVEILEAKLKKISQTIDNNKAVKERMDTLHNLAHYDALTNIPNRFLFNTKLQQATNKAMRHGTNMALFFIDLDDFKKINDTYGHHAGDAVLIHITQNIKHIIRQEDTLARIGGDELALIIEDISDENYINNLAEKILKASSLPLKFENTTIEISCSIGVATFPKQCSSAEELIKLADSAMYVAKKSGKKNFFKTL